MPVTVICRRCHSSNTIRRPHRWYQQLRAKLSGKRLFRCNTCRHDLWAYPN